MVRNGSLWSNVVFEKDVISHSKRERQITNLRTRVSFLSLFLCNFDDQLRQNFHRLIILCICENTGLWQIPNVSSAWREFFKGWFSLELTLTPSPWHAPLQPPHRPPLHFLLLCYIGALTCGRSFVSFCGSHSRRLSPGRATRQKCSISPTPLSD